MVIFLKPKDIPSVVNFITNLWKKIRSFIVEIQSKINEITYEIDNTKNDIKETFHDKIERLRLEINQQQDFPDFDDNKKTPKLEIEKNKKQK